MVYVLNESETITELNLSFQLRVYNPHNCKRFNQPKNVHKCNLINILVYLLITVQCLFLIWLGKKTEGRPTDLRVKWSPAHLVFTTYGGGFTLSLLMLNEHREALNSNFSSDRFKSTRNNIKFQSMLFAINAIYNQISGICSRSANLNFHVSVH